MGEGYKDTVPCLQSLDLLVLDLTVLLERLLHQALQRLQTAATITMKTSVYGYIYTNSEKLQFMDVHNSENFSVWMYTN